MIAEIILKKLREQLNREEEILFKKWLSENDENFLTYKRLKELHRNNVLLPNSKDINPQEAWKLISTEIQKNRPTKNNRFLYNSLFRYAAVFVSLIGCFFIYKSLNTQNVIETQIDPTAVILERGNGEIQVLSQQGEYSIVADNGNILGRKDDGVVDYSLNQVVEDDDFELEYNTVRVPNGKTFKIVLSDGTAVNLNSGSSLKYPVKFIKGKNREVSLIGEAFFDVRKNEHSPFIVTTGKMDVRVLGTKFNVTSYPEDTNQITVLVEGSVRLYEAGETYNEDDSTLLSPGYKADWNTTYKQMVVNKVNTELYTGWIEGKLAMKKMKFSNIIQRLQRHYNVKINNDYEALNERFFTATFETETMREVLETFKIETPFEYEIIGDSIHIYKQLNNDKK